MYQLFAQNTYDSEEVKEKFLSDKAVLQATDLTKATGRDDCLAYKLTIDAQQIGIDTLTITDEDKSQDETIFMANMKICDGYVKKLALDMYIDHCQVEVFSAKYELDLENLGIVSIVSIMYIETARKKQKEIMKKLYYNVE